MKIELKNVKHYPSMSEETECYEASLYVDGKKIGQVSNRGHGGPDDFYGDREAFAKAEAWVAANMPTSTIGDKEYPENMEGYCSTLLTDHLLRKDLKAALRKSVLILEGEAIMAQKFKRVSKIEEKHIAFVRTKNPGMTILNDLDFEEALKLFKKHT